MPNHVDNALTVTGSPTDVAVFIEAARGAYPKSGDQPGTIGYDSESKPAVPFCFHSLVPLPDSFSNVPYGTMNGGRRGYDMECETWGIKWGGYSPNRYPTSMKAMPKPITDPGVATYYFCTAWEAPIKVFLPRVAERFQSVRFLLSWGGEGPTKGRAEFRGYTRKIRDEPYRKEDYPGTDDDAGYEADKLVEQARLRTHPLWVGQSLTIECGLEFDRRPGVGPILADFLDEHGWHNLAKQVRELDAAEVVGLVP